MQDIGKKKHKTWGHVANILSGNHFDFFQFKELQMLKIFQVVEKWKT